MMLSGDFRSWEKVNTVTQVDICRKLCNDYISDLCKSFLGLFHKNVDSLRPKTLSTQDYFRHL